MEVRDASQKVVSLIPVITRLAKTGGKSLASTSARLVFDTVGEERYLSEVWIAGTDGFSGACNRREARACAGASGDVGRRAATSHSMVPGGLCVRS